jgi:hypothetical protein
MNAVRAQPPGCAFRRFSPSILRLSALRCRFARLAGFGFRESLSSEMFGCRACARLASVILAIHFVLGDMEWSQTRNCCTGTAGFPAISEFFVCEQRFGRQHSSCPKGVRLIPLACRRCIFRRFTSFGRHFRRGHRGFPDTALVWLGRGGSHRCQTLRARPAAEPQDLEIWAGRTE